MRLHENEQLFGQAILATAQQRDIPEIFIEKDYWVTYALYLIFNSDIGEETIFKGGTALSKCFGIIDRFSEDIDLVVKHSEGETDNQLKRKIKEIGRVVSTTLPEVNVEGLTQKMGMNRKTAHSYQKLFRGDFGQAREFIVLEATWLGYYEPYSDHTISTYIHDMMINTGQQVLVEEYGLSPFTVHVLDPRRTICEKIMSLVRFSYTENPVQNLKNKVRHIYDLHQLLNDEDLGSFFNSEEFDEMLQKVAQDDVCSFKNNNEWLKYHPKEAVIYKDLDSVWSELAAVYIGEFSNLVYGELPAEQDILDTLLKIKERVSSIRWSITI